MADLDGSRDPLPATLMKRVREEPSTSLTEKDPSTQDDLVSSALDHQDGVIEQLRVLYRDGGMYELISQMDHALQCAKLASDSGADQLTIVAALLHDVGWMLSARKTTAKDGVVKDGSEALAFDKDCLSQKLGILAECKVAEGATPEQLRAQHDIVGGMYLRMMGFDEKVPHLVEGHVLVKRYLTAKDPNYFQMLSSDSKRTLVFQGGPMDAAEMATVEEDSLFSLGKMLRCWDDQAKVEGLVVPDFDSYVPMLRRAMVKPPRDAASCSADAFYLREGTRIVGIRRSRSS